MPVYGGCGHAGIYYKDDEGNDWVLSFYGGSVHRDTLSHFLEYYGEGNTPVWGWQGGISVEMEENEAENSNDTNDNTSKKASTVTQVNGDGYSQEYTSSAGITYKHYKQYEGTYANNHYWTGTIHHSGCGPTSVAILASGLVDSNKTPADIAAEMDAKYRETSYITLNNEMNSLGMTSNVINSPSADDIKTNLQNGKVMLVSVNGNTVFTNNSHIMALVDINSSGQVYICNPGSSSLYGWYDISELMKGCNYIVVTDAKEPNMASISSNSSSSSYTAVVGTWQQIDTTVNTENDPNVTNSSQTQYTMTTTNINYEEMVKNYTMPFDLLWAFLVVGEDKEFAFELADLVYNSDIQITIHDNLTVSTDIDEWNYTQRTKAIVNADIIANCKEKSIADSIKNDVHDPDKGYDDPDNIKDKPYKTTKTVVTQTNTVDVALTRANTWIVDYQNDYTYVAPKETKTTDEVRKDNEEYKEQPDNIGDSYSCIHINMKKEELKKKMQELNGQSSDSDTDMSIETIITQLPPVVFNEKIKVEYYNKYINISDTVTNKVNTQEYTQGTPTVREKTDPKAEDEENFSTIFNKYEHRRNKSNIKDVSSWLFEIIETNESTANMADLVRYLLYKATGTSYGVKKYDFSEYDASQFTSVTSNITGNTIQEKVWFGLKAVGYSDVSVAAAMGNIHYESGTFDPKKVEGGYNENNGGIGICQWTNNNRGSQGRNTNLRKYAKSKGKTWQDEDIQVEFLIAEVTKNCKTDASKYAGFAFLNSTYTGTSYRYSEWTDAKDSDPLDKNQLNRLTEVFCFTFERPNADAGRSSMSTRQKYALQYYNQFHGKEAPTTSGSSIEVANGTAQQKLKYLFPNGMPTSDSQAKQYMATVDVPITTKSGTKTTAKLTIHKQLVSDVQDVFKTAQDNGFRIYSAGGYKFRPMNNGGSGKLSHHSYGVAIDINPNENYSHKGKTVFAGSFWNPSKSQYSIPKDGILVKAFKAKGWKWGGSWSSYQDYMHFSFTGN